MTKKKNGAADPAQPAGLQIIKRECSVVLDLETKSKLLDESAALDGRIEALEDEKKKAVTDFNEQIDALENRRRAISSGAREGRAKLTLDVAVENDWAENVVRYWNEAAWSRRAKWTPTSAAARACP